MTVEFVKGSYAGHSTLPVAFEINCAEKFDKEEEYKIKEYYCNPLVSSSSLEDEFLAKLMPASYNTPVLAVLDMPPRQFS